jgi:hypothetical protein
VVTKLEGDYRIARADLLAAYVVSLVTDEPPRREALNCKKLLEWRRRRRKCAPRVKQHNLWKLMIISTPRGKQHSEFVIEFHFSATDGQNIVCLIPGKPLPQQCLFSSVL